MSANQNLKPALISEGILNQILEYAIQTIIEVGIRTSNIKLLQLAQNRGLKVLDKRIYADKQQVMNALEHVKLHRLPADHMFGKYHSWLDNIVSRPNPGNLVIRVNDRATYYSDHRHSTFHPLSRKDVIEGTKLIHSLHPKYGVVGYSCGTPQESHELLKGIEQYMIGYRYNRLGGSTEVPSNKDILPYYLDIREIAEVNFSRSVLDVSIWSASPMILDSDELDFFFREGTSIKRVLIGSMPIMGLNGPVDPVGNLTLALAETLGGAAILHFLFPDTACYIMPHPQPMDLSTGLISFGTVEHFRLELLKTELFSFLDLPYAMVKDTLTSSQMPDQLSQSDKMLQIVSSITHGCTAFSICPLSCDEGWSPLQCLLDVEYIRNAWALHSPVNGEDKAAEAFRNIRVAVEENQLFASMDDTLINMFSNYETDVLFSRAFGYQKWQEMNRIPSIKAVEDRLKELLSGWNYMPSSSKWDDILRIYHKLSHQIGVKPADFEE